MVETVSIDLLGLLFVLTVAWVFGGIVERFGYPTMMGELFAGIAFGPALVGLLQPSTLLSVLSELGVFLLMVYVGMEVDEGPSRQDVSRPLRLPCRRRTAGVPDGCSRDYFRTERLVSANEVLAWSRYRSMG